MADGLAGAFAAAVRTDLHLVLSVLDFTQEREVALEQTRAEGRGALGVGLVHFVADLATTVSLLLTTPVDAGDEGGPSLFETAAQLRELGGCEIRSLGGLFGQNRLRRASRSFTAGGGLTHGSAV